MKKVFIVALGRSAIGSFGGSLSSFSPLELGQIVGKEVLLRAGIGSREGAEGVRNDFGQVIDQVILGNVLAAGHGMNLARQVALKSGLPVTVPAYTVNMVCASGLKAISLAAMEIQSGQAEAVLAGGVESMSQTGFVSLSHRWGSRLGHAEFKDLILQDGLTDYFHKCHMGITAETLAKKLSISRRDQDEFAVESQRRASLAIKEGHFREEIVSVPLMKRGKQVGVFEVDEFPRADTTIETLSGLKPAFTPDGTVTAGNASGINDGAAMLVVMSEERVKRAGLKPLAQIAGWACSGVEPEVMGLGPVEAVTRLCELTGISLSDVDCIEANEAFAAQAIAVNRSLNWSADKVNPNGGAIALGHPIGASGARILVSLVQQLRRSGKHLGIATLCVGGGQGIAFLVKNVG